MTGIGVVLGDIGDAWYLSGIDLDSCLDAEGSVAGLAKPILQILRGTYAEISLSRSGLKAFFFVAASDAAEACRIFGFHEGAWGCKRSIGEGRAAAHGPAVEVYIARRWFAVTMKHWPESSEYCNPDAATASNTNWHTAIT
jgi:hypothetical protein